MAHRMTAVHLSTTPMPAALPAAGYQARIFPKGEFVEMTISRVVDDHVLAIVADKSRLYAIGTLPEALRARLTPQARVGAKLAGTVKRTMLGHVADQVIEDLRDEDPTICPLALSAIRIYSPDPARVLRDYVTRALMLGEVYGKDYGRKGESLTFFGVNRRLTATIFAEGWALEADTLLIPHRLPATLCMAAEGRQLGELVTHAMIDGVDATIVSVEPAGVATQITYRTEALAIRALPEMEGKAAWT